MATIGETIRGATSQLRARSETPWLDVLVLLEHVSGVPRESLLARLSEPLSDLLDGAEVTQLGRLIHQRSHGLPVATLVGAKEFHGLTIGIEAGVLVPRPDSEAVVAAAVEYGLRLIARFDPETVRYHDAYTGSGCIGIATARALATSGTALELLLSDRSPVARACAASNARRLWPGSFDVRAADGVRPDGVNQPFHIVTANPPYLTSEETDLCLADGTGEAREALDGGRDGLDAYRAIAVHALDQLVNGGYLVVECGAGQAGDIARLLTAAGFAVIDTQSDLAGRDRAVVLQRPGTET